MFYKAAFRQCTWLKGARQMLYFLSSIKINLTMSRNALILWWQPCSSAVRAFSYTGSLWIQNRSQERWVGCGNTCKLYRNPVHRRLHTLMYTPLGINNPFTAMFLGAGKKPENPEETSVDTGRQLCYFCLVPVVKNVYELHEGLAMESSSES